VIDGVERFDPASRRKHRRRPAGRARGMFGSLTRNVTVTPRVRVSGIEDDFSRERRPNVLRQIGNSLERYWQHHYVAEFGSLSRRPGGGQVPETVHELLQLLGMT